MTGDRKTVFIEYVENYKARLSSLDAVVTQLMIE